MQRTILKVDDIEKSIRENGLEYYVDRLLQDGAGQYYWVESEIIDYPTGPILSIRGWRLIELVPHDKNRVVRYRIVRIPKEIAWFCIDAIKLKTQVLNIGNGTYGDGPHGGDIQYFIKDGDQFKEIPVKAVRVETL